MKKIEIHIKAIDENHPDVEAYGWKLKREWGYVMLLHDSNDNMLDDEMTAKNTKDLLRKVGNLIRNKSIPFMQGKID